MKKTYFKAGVLALAGILGTGFASGQSKLNNAARLVAEEAQAVVANADGNQTDAPAEAQPVNILIVVEKGATAADINTESLVVGSQIGSVLIATIDADKLFELANNPKVKSVELAEEVQVDMIHVRQGAQTGISTVHRNLVGKSSAKVDAELGHPFLGTGVITSLYDTGLDPNHLNFRIGDNYETSRVKGVYVYSGSSGSNYTAYETPEEIAGFTTEDATAYHGSHVLGILAGSYRGPGTYGEYVFKNASGVVTDSLQLVDGDSKTRSLYRYPTYSGVEGKEDRVSYVPYYGVAPASEILVGCGPLYNNNMLNMAQRVRDIAKAEGKPAVINFSIGNTVGPKDGSTAFNQALAEVGKDIIISMSSSNDGNEKGWITKKFSGADNSFATFISPAAATTSKVGVNYHTGNLQFWGNDDKPFDITFFTYNVLTGERIDLGTIKEATEKSVRFMSNNFNGTSETIDYRRCAAMDSIFDGYFTVTGSVNALNNRFSYAVSFPSGTKYIKLHSYSDRFPTSNEDAHIALGVEVKGAEGQTVWANAKTSYFHFADNHTYTASTGVKNVKMGTFTDGSSDNSVNDLACGENVFVVGNYVARSRYATLKDAYLDPVNGSTSGWVTNSATPGDINASSSYASNLVDGRQLPHLAMPGTNVVSSNNSYYVDPSLATSTSTTTKNPVRNTAVAKFDGKEYFWMCISGTSMSSPAFAGSCALFLEADPTLKWNDIYDVLKTTCRNDEYTAAKPVHFGLGKVDVYAALKEILKRSSVAPVYDIEDKITVSSDNGNINIAVGDTDEFTASIYNINGIKVASEKAVGELNLSTSELAKGVYIVNVSNAKINKSAKVVVK